MKQIRQILAILGIVVLVAMYTSTLVFFIISNNFLSYTVLRYEEL